LSPSGLVAIGALAHAQQASPQPKIPKPTLADAQNVVQIVTSDKVKSQAYCDLTKLEGQVQAAAQNNDAKTLESAQQTGQCAARQARSRILIIEPCLPSPGESPARWA
jgi:hypothetical protein